MAHINKIFYGVFNTSKMTFSEKKIMCKNNVGIISNLKIKFDYENYYNYNNITVIYILQPYISSIKKIDEALIF
jgi:hypothetical protein